MRHQQQPGWNTIKRKKCEIWAPSLKIAAATSLLPRNCWPAESDLATKPTPWYILTWSPITVVSPTTVPVQWSTKKCVPMRAPGCKSIPVRACAHSVMMRGMRGMFSRYNSCASRCTAMASTKGYATMTSSLLNAAGSPLKAASISVFRISRTREKLLRNLSVKL